LTVGLDGSEVFSNPNDSMKIKNKIQKNEKEKEK